MRTEHPTKCFVTLQKLRLSCARKTSLSPQSLITPSSKAVVLLWFSVVCYLCQSFGDVSPYVCKFSVIRSVMSAVI